MLQKVIQKSSKGWEVRSQLLLFAWNPSPLTLPTAPRHFPLGTIPLCHLLLVWLTPFPGESKAARVSNLVNKKSLCPDSPQLVDSKCKTQVGPVTINTETFGGVIRKYMFPLLPRGPKPVRWTHGATRIIFAALQSLSLNKSTWKKVKPEDWVGWRGGHCTLDSAIWIFTYILWSFFLVMWANKFSFAVGFCHFPLKVKASISSMFQRPLSLRTHASLCHAVLC